jgi:hypothetical protein
MKSLHYVLKRLNRLTDTLGELKERVRDAIAGELSRVVAQTVQDVVQCFMRGQPLPAPQHHPPPHRPHWQDEEDPWAEEQEQEYRRDEQPKFEDEPDDVPLQPQPSDRWHRAVEIGTTVLRWCMAGRWKPIVGLGVAGLAASATYMGGPTILAGASVVLAAAELISFGAAHTLR